MSFGIAHMQKFTKGTIKGVEIHNYRVKGVSHTNPDIDFERSYLNEDLHNDGSVKYQDVIKKRISELDLKRAVRKDAILMCGFVITSDTNFFSSLSDSEIKTFFKDSYEFFKNRYGANNVIASMVHYDEKTPHMHFDMIPVTKDGRLSAKSLFTRVELNMLHSEFHKHVGKKYGLERGIEGSTSRHIDTNRLKAITAREEVRELEDKQIGLQARICLSEELLMDKSTIECIEPVKTITGAIKGVSKEEIEILKISALQGKKAIGENKLLQEEIKKLKSEIKFLNRRDVHVENKQLRKSKKNLQEDNQRISERLKQSIPQDKHNQLLELYHEELKKTAKLTTFVDTLKKSLASLQEMYNELTKKLGNLNLLRAIVKANPTTEKAYNNCVKSVSRKKTAENQLKINGKLDIDSLAKDIKTKSRNLER